MIYDTIDITNLRNITSGAIDAANKSGRAGVIPKTGDTDSFSSIFDTALNNLSITNGYLSEAENEELKFSLGLSQNTHDLTVSLQKASTALQYTVAVRDKMLEAYKELMQMQI